VNALGLDPHALAMESHEEHYDDVGSVPTWVVDLETRWNDERERSRVFVGPTEAALSVDVVLPAPAAVAWEYLTSPQKRLLWQVDEIEQVDAGGRRRTGSSSVCVDGRAKIYEEIVDWRPFDYFTERISLPGRRSVLLTTALEPDSDATRVVTRARPDGGHRVGWLTAAPRLRRRLQTRYRRLAALVPAQIPEERRLPLAAAAPSS
jgi:hypothetical protein